MSPPLRPGKWNAKAVMRLMAGARGGAGAAATPCMTERKILRLVSMKRLPCEVSGLPRRIAEVGNGFYASRCGREPADGQATLGDRAGAQTAASTIARCRDDPAGEPCGRPVCQALV